MLWAKLSRKIEEYPLNQLIYPDHLETHIALSISNVNVLPLLVYPYFELDIVQDEIRKG